MLALPSPLAALAALAAAASLLASPLQAASVTTPDGGHYAGPLRDGLLHGEGRMDWDSGAHYEGSFEAGSISGQGRMVLPDGSRLEGMFRNGSLNGEGRHLLPDGSERSGWFRHGLLHGHGRYHGPDGTYQGSFRDGRYSGRGELATPGGVRYRGEFSMGRFNGKGRYETEAGDIYEGEFRDDQFSGKGQWTRADGGRHQGEFLNWLPNGAGQFADPSGVVYEGRFEQGTMTGPGRIRYPDRSVYEGQIEQWLPSGNGVLAFANGDRYEGHFVDGQPDGEGVMTYAEPHEGVRSQHGRWEAGELVDGTAQRARRQALEQLIYTEPDRLQAALDAVSPGDPEVLELYLLTVAGDGSQEVFRRETEFVRHQFEADFGTRGRSISLTNTRSLPPAAPVATRTSIRRAIEALAMRMNREQDILFLYLSSHGSPSHALSLAQPDFDLDDLQARDLAEVLRSSGIRWRVVVVSACFSGGFIAPLRDPGTLVITAARHDRRSFGCADENDFTYFGRAFFKDALPGSSSFQDAFRIARRLIRERELALLQSTGKVSESDFSLPQIEAPPAIEKQLRAWWPGPRPMRRPGAAGDQREASASPSFSIR